MSDLLTRWSDMLMKTALEQLLAADEGLRLMPYKCSAGVLSIRYGTALTLTEEEALLLLLHRLEKVLDQCELRFPWWPRLSPARKQVIASMGYQMGMDGLMGFRKMLAAVERGDYDTAGKEMMDSKWARSDSPASAQRLRKMMVRG